MFINLINIDLALAIFQILHKGKLQSTQTFEVLEVAE